MNYEAIEPVREGIRQQELSFTRPPVLVGGRAMEFYGLRKSGEDVDLIVTDGDYQDLAAAHPGRRKDIWGDLGVVLWPFEIWRSVMYFDHAFYSRGAVDCGDLLVVSPETLLLTRVYAMDNPKYVRDLDLLKDYLLLVRANPQFLSYSHEHSSFYQQGNGIIFGGEYKE